jgi:hypothetical protein
MANKTGRLTNMVESSTGLPIELSLVDNGDGTYSLAQATPAGASVDIGAKADTAATTDAGTFSLIALFKRLLQRFVVDSTDRIRVSLYGKASAAGDTAILLSTAGRQLVGLINTSIADGYAVAGSGFPDQNDTVRPLAVYNYSFNGALFDKLRTPTVFKDLSAVAIGTIATVWTPAGGKKFRLMGGVISVSAAVNVLFEDNAGAAFVFRVPKLLVDTPLAFTLGGNGFLSAVANNVLKATSSAAANITGTLYGTEE